MSSGSQELWEFLFKAIEFGIIPFIGYVVKKLSDISEELKALRTTLIGIDGKNGIRSRLNRLERKIENHLERRPENYSRNTDEMELDS